MRVRHDAGGQRRHRDVEHGTDQERADDADRHVALGILCFLRCRTDSVETNVREKHNPGALHDAAPAEMPARAGARRDERMPVGGIHRVSCADDEHQHDRHFNKHNDIIDCRRFANADH